MIVRRVACWMLLWAVFLVSADVFADGFRCPITDRLVEAGDSMAKVTKDCGAPKSRTDVFETVCSDNTGRCFEVKAGERWVYDFGSTYLVRYLLFRDDLLVLIETGMYGGRH